MNTTELRLYSPRVGFWTQQVGTTGQAAINVVKAQVPDARVISLKVIPEVERRDDRRTESTGWREGRASLTGTRGT